MSDSAPTSLLSWLYSAVGPLATRVLSSLGIGWVSYEGISNTFSYLKDSFIDSWGGIPADIASFLALGGFGTAFSVIFGAMTYRVAIKAFSKLGRLVA